MRAALNVGYPDEVCEFLRSRTRTKLGSRSEVWDFLLNMRLPCRFLDHWGHDADDNLISEPYAANCQECLDVAKDFALRIGAVYTLSPITYHAPWIAECVRMTFVPPRW